jgi:predicted CXXCH cytochrome family protein
MKKVLLLAAAAMLLAAPAMAAISGTAHDLSSTNGTAFAGNSDEICVYCHTPHGASAAVNAPLWNRGTIASSAIYANATLDASITAALVDGSDAALCLSCHDGASLAVALNNPPTTGQPTFAGGQIVDGATTKGNIGTDLSNDHPVGFSYTAALVSADGELEAKATIETGAMAGALSFGGGDEMWCSSCHDVHGVTGVDSFLRVSNASSALCLTCHIK